MNDEGNRRTRNAGGHVIERIASKFSELFKIHGNSADLNARSIVYKTLGQHLSERLKCTVPELMPALLAFLGEQDPELIRWGSSERGDQNAARTARIEERLQDVLIQVDVRYQRILEEKETERPAMSGRFGRERETARTRESFVLDCVVLAAFDDDDQIKRVTMTRPLSWDDLPSLVRDHFIRAADEVELRLYPIQSSGEGDGAI